MRDNQPVSGHRAAVKNGANILSTTDARGWITYVNDELIAISGFSKEELVGQPHNIVRHPDMPRGAFELMWKNLRAGKSWMGLIKNRCKNGDHYWVHAYATPIIDGSGNVLEYQSIRSEPPSEEAVRRAERIYQAMRRAEPDKGPVPAPKRQHHLPLSIKLALWFVVSLAPMLLTARASPLLGAVLSAALFYAGAHVLLRPLRSLVRASRQIADDPLMQEVLIGRRDEVATVEMAILSLRTELGSVTKRLKETLSLLTRQAGEAETVIGASVADIERQSEQTTQVAASATEMSQTVQEIALQAGEAASTTNQARTVAAQGQQIVNASQQAMDSLAERIRGTGAVVGRLVERSAEITRVLEVIQGITEQTNLLALNAAIEAARAGEVGRGFSVVADEVRTLANRTHKATDEIQLIIEGLQQAGQEAAQAMDKSRDTVDEALKHAEQSCQVLDKLAQAVVEIGDLTTGIAGITEQQSAAAEQIRSAVTNIDQMAKHASHGAGRAKQGMASLAKEVAGSARLVQRFAVTRSEPAEPSTSSASL